MGGLFGRIGSLLTATPGNLIYQIVLAFSVAGALQIAYGRWRTSSSSRDRRALRALLVMLAVIGLYFMVGVLVNAMAPGASVILPPLDRGVTLLLFTWSIWVWVFPDPSRQPDRAVILVSGLVVAGGALALVAQMLRTPGSGYNQGIANIVWQLATLALLGLGLFLLYIRKTDGFVLGMVFMGVAFLGHAAHLAVREPGDYSGIVRLAHIVVFPLLLVLAERSVRSMPAEGREPQPTDPSTSRQYGPDPKAVHALLALAGESEPARIHQAITRAVGRSLLADLSFLVLTTEDQAQVNFAAGYDLIREDYLEGARVDASMVPRILQSLRAGRPLRLQSGGTADDLRAIGELLGLKQTGDLLSAAMMTPDNQPIGALVVLSPYSQRRWTTEDQNLLVSIAVAVTPIVHGRDRTPLLAQELDGLANDLQTREEEVQRLQRRNEDLSQQLDALALENESSGPAGASELVAAKEAAEARVQELEQRLGAQALAGREPAEQQLNETLRDLARLQNQLALAEQQIRDLQGGVGGEKRKKEQAEVIASISQELRQPMSSIIGYTDLLLGESVGILGALQRKFIERIKASTERIGGLVNDLIQLTTLEVGLSDLKPEAMDLNVIIDNALAYTSSQLREKKISIHLDLPKSVAAVNADREALQQILIHLLQNAGAATPMEGTIGVKVRTTTDEGQPHVQIQVTDSGGGIPEEDLARVFTRLFRADNVLIQGVGDTGVGLSIAKTLTEAQHGRIWVESQPGSGASFCVLLPAVPDIVSRIPGREQG